MARMDCHCDPQLKELHAGDRVKNAKGTQNDLPSYSDSWINYWEALTKSNAPDICPLCGESIAKGKANGCHVLIKQQGKDDYDTKYYIIPGCQSCNCQSEEEFTLNSDIKVVEAVKKK